MNTEKKTIFVLFTVVWIFFGIPIYLSFSNAYLGLFVFMFLLIGIVFLLFLSGTSFRKIFFYYRAKRKGKKFYGYIYKIVGNVNKERNEVVDKALDVVFDAEQKNFINEMSSFKSNLTLKIVLFDDDSMETVMVDQNMIRGDIELSNIRPDQYAVLYKYKDKYCIMPEDIIPKFVIPKSQRMEIQKKIDKSVY